MILPICYGELAMTGEEIARVTPYEIMRRVEGYKERMKNRRIFTASFLTAPLINSSYRAPKRAVSVKKLLPGDFETEIPKEKLDHMLEVVKEAEKEEERRKNGRS